MNMMIIWSKTMVLHRLGSFLAMGGRPMLGVAAFEIFMGDTDLGTPVPRNVVTGAIDEQLFRFPPASGARRYNSTHIALPGTTGISAIGIERGMQTDDRTLLLVHGFFGSNPMAYMFPLPNDVRVETRDLTVSQGPNAGFERKRIGAVFSHLVVKKYRGPRSNINTASNIYGAKIASQYEPEYNYSSRTWKDYQERERALQIQNATRSQQAQALTEDRALLVSLLSLHGRVGPQIAEASRDAEQMRNVRLFLDSPEARSQAYLNRFNAKFDLLRDELEAEVPFLRNVAQGIIDNPEATDEQYEPVVRAGCYHVEAHPMIDEDPVTKEVLFPTDEPLYITQPVQDTGPSLGTRVSTGHVRIRWIEGKGAEFHAIYTSEMAFRNAPPLQADQAALRLWDPALPSPHFSSFTVGSPDGDGSFPGHPWSMAPAADTRTQKQFSADPITRQIWRDISSIPANLDWHKPPQQGGLVTTCDSNRLHQLTARVRDINVFAQKNKVGDPVPAEQQLLAGLIADSLPCTLNFYIPPFGTWRAPADLSVWSSSAISHGFAELAEHFAVTVQAMRSIGNFSMRHDMIDFINGNELVYHPNRDGGYLAHNHDDDHDGRTPGAGSQAVQEAEKTTASKNPAPSSCDTLNFEGSFKLVARDGCDVDEQHCLFLKDVTVMNLRLAADSVAFASNFDDYVLTTKYAEEGVGTPLYSSVENITLENSELLYNENSIMHVEGVGKFVGAQAIRNFKVQSTMFKNSRVKKVRAQTRVSRIEFEMQRHLDWANATADFTKSNTFKVTRKYLPCGMIVDEEFVTSTDGTPLVSPASGYGGGSGTRNAKKQALTCNTARQEELVASTLRALPWCLADLTRSFANKCGANCTQAVNTFLAPHVTSGLLESCRAGSTGLGTQTDGTGSMLLHELNLDADTLLGRCSTSSDNLVRDDASLQTTTARECYQPDEYMSRSGCSAWNWAKLEAAMQLEYSEDTQRFGKRFTASELVARAEQPAISLLLQNYYNKNGGEHSRLVFSERMMVKTSGAADDQGLYAAAEGGAQVWFSPTVSTVNRGHASYRKYVTTQAMNRTDGHNALTKLLWWDKLDPKLSKIHADFSRSDAEPEFAQRKSLYKKMLPAALKDFASLSAEKADDPYDFSQWETAIVLPDLTHLPDYHADPVLPGALASSSAGDMSKQVIDYVGRRYFDAQSGFQAEKYYEFSSSILPVVQMEIASGDESATLSGHAFFAGLMARHFGAFRELNGTTSWRNRAVHALLTTQLIQATADDVLRSYALQGAVDNAVLTSIIAAAVKFIRKDECRYAWHFEQSPRNFLLEFMRLHVGTAALNVFSEKNPLDASAADVMHMLPGVAHNMDPHLFPEPWKFDSTRPNLRDVALFGAIEGDIPDATAAATDESINLFGLGANPILSGNSARRMWLGRETYFFPLMTKMVKRYVRTSGMLEERCAYGNAVTGGIAFTNEVWSGLLQGSSSDFSQKVADGHESPVHGTMDVYIAASTQLEESVFGAEATVDPIHAKDDVTDVFIFLHGFPHVPQSWSALITKLQPQQPNAAFISVALPGMGQGAALDDCRFSGDAEAMLVHFVQRVSRRWKGASIYLVGQGLGSYLAWRTTDKLNKDLVHGLITFDPHPNIVFAALSTAISAKQAPFWPMLNPLIGESLIAAGDFVMLEKLMEAQYGNLWYADGLGMDQSDTHTSDTLKLEYRRQWELNGARRMTCYFRDNFRVRTTDEQTQSIAPVDTDWGKLDPAKGEVSVLFLRAEQNLLQPDKMFKESFAFLTPHAGNTWAYHTVMGANSSQILFDDTYVEEVADQIEKFVMARERIKYSLYQFVVVPPTLSGGLVDAISHDIGLPFALTAALIAVVGGVMLERQIGFLLVQMRHKETFWRFGQVCMVPLCLACTASQSWLGLPIFFAALFKFGFPEVTTLLFMPWRRHDLGVDRLDANGAMVDGIAYLVHHTGTSIGYASVLVHLLEPTWMVFLLPLAGQHLVSPLKYANEYIYGGLLVLMEIWFQLEYFHAVPHIHHLVPFIGLTMVFIAHYIWLGKAIFWPVFELIFARKEEDDLLEDKEGISGGRASARSQRGSIFMEASLAKHAQRVSSHGGGAQHDSGDSVSESDHCYKYNEEFVGSRKKVDFQLPRPSQASKGRTSEMRASPGQKKGHSKRGSIFMNASFANHAQRVSQSMAFSLRRGRNSESDAGNRRQQTTFRKAPDADEISISDSEASVGVKRQDKGDDDGDGDVAILPGDHRTAVAGYQVGNNQAGSGSQNKQKNDAEKVKSPESGGAASGTLLQDVVIDSTTTADSKSKTSEEPEEKMSTEKVVSEKVVSENRLVDPDA